MAGARRLRAAGAAGRGGAAMTRPRDRPRRLFESWPDPELAPKPRPEPRPLKNAIRSYGDYWPRSRYGYGRENRLWRMQFSYGGYSDAKEVYVWADSEDDALEVSADVVKDYWPGIFVSDEELRERYEEACREEGIDPREYPPYGVIRAGPHERALQRAEEDLTYTESGWIPSENWWMDEITDEETIRLARRGRPR